MSDSSDLEDEYFRRLEAEKRAMRRAKLDKTAKDLEALGTDDADVGERIKALGFDGDTAAAFHLLPLVHVAWADGSITRNERAAIFAALEARGEGPESAAGQHMATLLEERPSDQWMERSLELLRAVVGAKVAGDDIIGMCAMVADSSGGFLGFGNRVSDDERAVLAKVADALGDNAVAAFKDRFG